MDLDDLIAMHREPILAVAERYGAHEVRVFGSVARGEAGPESDVDLLVAFEPGRSLLDQAGLVLDLETLLGQRVEVVTERSLKPLMRDEVLHEAIAL